MNVASARLHPSVAHIIYILEEKYLGAVFYCTRLKTNTCHFLKMIKYISFVKMEESMKLRCLSITHFRIN